MLSSSSLDQGESIPQLSKMQLFSVDGIEVVTQEFMVAEQLERERIRVEEKKSVLELKIEDYWRRKSGSGSMAVCKSDFTTKLSLPKFIAVRKCLAPDQEQYVQDIGHRSLLDLCLEEIPRSLVFWIAKHFKPKERIVSLPNGFSFALNQLCVHKVLGTPIGGSRIPNKCSDRFRDVIRMQTWCEGSTPSINEPMIFLKSCLDADDFKRYWMMFSVTSLLCPTTYECASPNYFQLLKVQLNKSHHMIGLLKYSTRFHAPLKPLLKMV